MKFKLLFILILVFLITGCSESEDAPLLSAEDVVLVEVDGRPVTLAMLEFLMESRGVSEDDPEQMRQLLDELIRLRAMANAAEAEGVSTDPKVRAERMIKDIEVQYVRYLEHFQEQNPITDAEIQQVYSQQVQRAGTVRYRLQTIVFDQQSVAVESLNGLLDGTVSFDQEIERAETDGRAVLSPNWVDRSQVPAEVSAALAQTAAGEPVGALMPYQDQWVVARVLETQANTIPSLEEVREGIRRTLAREQNQLLIDDRFDSADIVPMLPLDDAAVDDDNGGE